MDNNEKFINRVNKLIEQLDYKKLDHSCNDEDKSYAKDFLGKLHSAFIESYGTDYLDYSSGEFVELPAVIRGEKTGVIAIGLVNVDLHSSGEHYGTYIFSKYGIIDHGGDNTSPRLEKYMTETFVPYQYWYTPYIADDHHVDFNSIPKEVKEIMSEYLPDEDMEIIGLNF